jgi:hypothetical protein
MKQIAVVGLALASLAASAAEPAIFVSMKVEHDGKAIGTPSVLVADAHQTRLTIGNRLQIEMVAADLADSADLRMRVYSKSDEALNLVGTPRVVVPYGQEAAVAWSMQRELLTRSP